MATYYWVGGTGTWDNTNTANWSATSGGAGGVGPPTNVGFDTAIFDANSGTGTCTTAATAEVRTLTFGSANMTLILGANLTLSGGSAACSAGVINLNSFTLTVLALNIDGSGTRSIQFGTGKIVVTGNNTTVLNAISMTNFSYTGTPRVEFTYSGSTGTRQFFSGSTSGTSAANVLSLYITGGTDIISFRGHTKDLSLSGFAGTFNATVQGTNIYGDLIAGAGSTFNATLLSFLSTSTGKIITSNGATLATSLRFNGVGGGWTLQDNLTIPTANTLTLVNGTLNANDKNVTIGNFALDVGTKTLTLGNGTWTVTGANWNANTNVTNLTVSASTGTISMTSGSAKTFAGGAKTWPTLNQGGAGALTIQQSNTFANITNTVQPATVTLTAGTTQTVSAFSLAGTAGNLITLNTSSAGTQATLSDSSGIVSVSFVSVKDINATGGAVWNAYSSSGNIDAGNNTGWDFNDLLFRYIYTRRKNKVIFPI